MFLVGCATRPTEIVTVVQKIEVPIAVRCDYPYVEPPTMYFDRATKQTSSFDAIKLLAAENKSLEIYAKNLKAALVGCAKDPSEIK